MVREGSQRRKRVAVRRKWFLLVALPAVILVLIVWGILPAAPPAGCSASNVDYYTDSETGSMDITRMNRLDWIPVSAADSAEIVGCVPQALADPTNDNGRALLEFGEGDPNVPLPIFTPDGSLFGYFVVYKGSVPLGDAIANGDVPDGLVRDPPKVTDFDPDFAPRNSDS